MWACTRPCNPRSSQRGTALHLCNSLISRKNANATHKIFYLQILPSFSYEILNYFLFSSALFLFFYLFPLLLPLSLSYLLDGRGWGWDLVSLFAEYRQRPIFQFCSSLRFSEENGTSTYLFINQCHISGMFFLRVPDYVWSFVIICWIYFKY